MLVAGWLALSILYYLYKEEHKEIKLSIDSFSYNNGTAFLIYDDIALTAYHVAERTPADIIYSDELLDLAMIKTTTPYSNELSEGVILQKGTDAFVVNDLIHPGNSGSPYIEDNILKGIYVGRSEGGSVVVPISPELYKQIERRCN